MPTYDYHCSACNEDMEIFQSIKDDPLTVCPKCGKPELKRKIGTGAGIIFKGSGFYETDYKRSKAASSSAKETPAAKADAPATAPAKTSETK